MNVAIESLQLHRTPPGTGAPHACDPLQENGKIPAGEHYRPSVPKAAQVLSENSPVPSVLYLWAVLCMSPFQTRSFIVKHSSPRGALQLS